MERKERKETEWAVQAEKEVWLGNLKPGLEDTHQIRQSSSLVFSGANFMGFAVKNLMPSPAGCKKLNTNRQASHTFSECPSQKAQNLPVHSVISPTVPIKRQINWPD